ncbi:MAG: hypothetical protein ABI389_06430 [Rhodanobacter sp.]
MLRILDRRGTNEAELALPMCGKRQPFESTKPEPDCPPDSVPARR